MRNGVTFKNFFLKHDANLLFVFFLLDFTFPWQQIHKHKTMARFSNNNYRYVSFPKKAKKGQILDEMRFFEISL